MRSLVLASSFWFFVAAAFPCSIVQTPHEIDQALVGVDLIAPSAPQAEVERITRGKGPVQHDAETVSVSSCDDIGFLEFGFSRLSEDDRAAAEEIGYLFELAEGELPAGFAFPETPLRMIGGGRGLTLHWSDGATDEQKPLDFAVRIVAVDRAGNRSVTSDAIPVRDPGRRVSATKQ